MDTDRNLLFGVLALQADLIDQDQFVRACTLWSAQKATPLADLLVQQGWLTPADRADVEKLLDRKLRKHQGDARAGLTEVTTDRLRKSIAGLDDNEVQKSLAGAPPPEGHILLTTTAFVPEVGERYTLSRLHATGGIGRVWLARDASLARDVALKELRPERADNPAVWARFLKEAQITGQLEHPGIVPIYEMGTRPDDRAPYYTMRFVRGRTLDEAARAYHQRRKRGEAAPLELRELLGAFVGVCNAVAYAHSRGVLHRDLKPKNVVLGDFGEVIVLDWGLARLIDQPDGEEAAPLDVPADSDLAATMQGQVLGTPAYMAPEQPSSTRCSPASRRSPDRRRPRCCARSSTNCRPGPGRWSGRLRGRWKRSVSRPWRRGRSSDTARRRSWPTRSGTGWPTSRWRPTPTRCWPAGAGERGDTGPWWRGWPPRRWWRWSA
jgi:tRNA A-37 threonylcarbamoyl transferase component Bud32